MKFKIKISLKNNYCKHTGYWLFNRSSMQSSIRWSLCNNRIVSVGLIIVPPAFKNPTKLRRYVCLPVSINSGNWIEASNMTWIIQVVQEFFQQKFFRLWNLFRYLFSWKCLSKTPKDLCSRIAGMHQYT